jgi:hypothetical protein
MAIKQQHEIPVKKTWTIPMKLKKTKKRFTVDRRTIILHFFSEPTMNRFEQMRENNQRKRGKNECAVVVQLGAHAGLARSLFCDLYESPDSC